MESLLIWEVIVLTAFVLGIQFRIFTLHAGILIPKVSVECKALYLKG